MLGSLWAAATLVIASIVLFGADAAMAGMGQPTNGQLGMQVAASPIAQQIHEFHDMVNTLIIMIVVFVMILLVYVMFRFNAKANPTPSRTTHNTLLEVAWTVVPIMILVYIALPSFRLLRAQYDYPPADLTIKATAYQWYWNHEYLPKEKDAKGFTFDSVMLSPEEIKEKQAEGISAPRNLAVDNEVVVPLNKNVHVLVTAGDVLHNWTVPGFGSKVDAVPGRINATWFKATKTGIFYGQCSELCGKDHAFMPIAVRVVDDGTFKEWSSAMAARDRKKAHEILKRVALEQAGKKTADAHQ